MHTRRSPNNQERLFKLLFKHPALTARIQEARECQAELASLHAALYPECDGEGCPAGVYLAALEAAIQQASATQPRWNADLAGDLERAIKDAHMEIGQFPAS